MDYRKEFPAQSATTLTFPENFILRESSGAILTA
jgi:hypothetical protein